MTSDGKNPRLKDLAINFFRIGLTGFGGGMAMLALIRDRIVARRRWISDDDLATAVAMGQMLPGPFVPNYVEYIGYKLRGMKGMLVSVVSFLLPSYFLTLLLSILYFQYYELKTIHRAFSFIAPLIPPILFWGGITMAKIFIKEKAHLLLAIFSFILACLKVEMFWLIIIAGLIGILSPLIKRRFILTLSIFSIFGAFILKREAFLPQNLELFYIFLKIGAITFGGGFAAIPFIKQEVVDFRQWIEEKDFLAGIGISQITPGPVAILATFVGYKVTGILGSLIATVGIFLPSAIMLYFLIQLYRKIEKNFWVQNFLSGIKPAIIGLIFQAGFSLALIGIKEWSSVLFAIAAFLSLFFLKIEPLYLILVGGILGLLLT